MLSILIRSKDNLLLPNASWNNGFGIALTPIPMMD
jgi:hypothetical protein